jgi:cyclopropane fatty-acyl-phospholipid synthase-like methyltransferase
MDGVREEMEARYASGDVPWDNPLPPPELIALVEEMPPGRALDLGCGYGRAAIYLAQHGWQVDGVDFVALAVEEARRRARAAGVEVAFHHGSVTDLSFLQPPYDLAVDVGCGHNLGSDGWKLYHAELRRLLRPGGLFLLFSHVRRDGEEAEGEQPTHGLDQGAFLDLFSNGFHAEQIVHGETVMPNGRWPSAWFWMRRILRRR